MAVQRFSDSDILDALRLVANQIGTVLSVTKYDHNRANDQPSSALIIQRFSTWNQALSAADLPQNEAQQKYKSRFTLADAIGYTREFLAEVDRPSYQGFSEWIKKQPDAPSAQTCRKLAGSWQNLLSAARV